MASEQGQTLEGLLRERYGEGRGGRPNTRVAAEDLGVARRQVQRWLKAESEGREIRRSDAHARLVADPAIVAASDAPAPTVDLDAFLAGVGQGEAVAPAEAAPGEGPAPAVVDDDVDLDAFLAGRDLPGSSGAGGSGGGGGSGGEDLDAFLAGEGQHAGDAVEWREGFDPDLGHWSGPGFEAEEDLAEWIEKNGVDEVAQMEWNGEEWMAWFPDDSP